MAKNLAAAGHEVVGFDVFPAAVEAARDAGLGTADIGDGCRPPAGSDRRVVITMFQSGAQVIDGVSRHGRRGGPARPSRRRARSSSTRRRSRSTRRARAHALAEAAGHRSIDAPVSGGVVGAENATLAFMVGGSDEDFEAARPLLEAMGRRIVHCGGAGLGQAAKVCNNMILAVSQIAVAEAFVLGERLGLTHQALFDVASNASGQCWALTTNCPVPGPVPTSPANRDYQPGFAGTLMSKDLGLAEQAIDLTGVDARMGRLAREIYKEFADGAGSRAGFLRDHQHDPRRERTLQP